MNICIINDTDTVINYNSLEKGCGGSETWALQLAQAFVNRGHLVIICTTTNENFSTMLYNNKINIVPIDKIEDICNQFTFDFMIISRVLSKNMYHLIKTNYNISKYIFYQYHDLYPLESNYKETFSIVNKVVALTPFHAKHLHIMTDYDYSKFTIIPNAIDLNLFTNIQEPEQRDNRILWCSNPDRGLNIILKYLYDDIKKEIPDFGIDICYPNYSSFDDTQLISGRDIRNMGSLNKTDLYKEMVKHKCWCYPQNFIDTFCIGMLEQSMCNVNIVCPWWYAPNDIFGDLNINNKFEEILDNTKKYSQSFLKDNIYTSKEKFNNYLMWLKDQIIDAIKYYDSEENRIRRYNMRMRVIQSYNWNNIAQLYENLYINEKVQHGDC